MNNRNDTIDLTLKNLRELWTLFPKKTFSQLIADIYTTYYEIDIDGIRIFTNDDVNEFINGILDPSKYAFCSDNDENEEEDSED